MMMRFKGQRDCGLEYRQEGDFYDNRMKRLTPRFTKYIYTVIQESNNSYVVKIL